MASEPIYILRYELGGMVISEFVRAFSVAGAVAKAPKDATKIKADKVAEIVPPALAAKDVKGESMPEEIGGIPI